MSAIIVYPTREQAEFWAQDALFRWEMFLRPEEVIERNDAEAIHIGLTLVFDVVAADAYARNMHCILSVCMECGRTIAEKPGGGKVGVSHGYCGRCEEKIRREWKRGG